MLFLDALTRPPQHYLSLMLNGVTFILNVRFTKELPFGRTDYFETLS